ncbi:MAG: hypothetical protein IKA87_06580 [Lentisphaeria bacterium]|nr:hypothetical protein [Lentisphaeria bacterium]
MKVLFAIPVLFFIPLFLGGSEIMLHKPTLQYLGKRIVNRRTSPGNSGVITMEKIPELGYRFIIALQNKGSNITRLATGFNHIRFDAEPGKNLFVLRLSHNLMSFKPGTGENAFPLILPVENFRIVTLHPGEGTMLNVTCWIPEEKLRSGDKLAVEYAPRNFKRYDFMQMRIRSEAIEFKFPVKNKKNTPVII